MAVSLDITLDLNSGVPFYRQIIDQVKAAIATESIAAGDRLPTVRQLAVDLKINSNTVARVYRDLQGEGLLVLKRGIGTFVSDTGPVRPMSDDDVGALEQRVDSLIELSCRMKVTPIELFQLIETRWKENC